MKRVLHIALWFLGAATFVVLVAFERISEHKTRISDVQINLIQPGGQLFLADEDILQVIKNEDDSLLFRPIAAINSTLLEESLENHPFVADAEVFSTLDGLLSVQVKQKEAVARVIQSSRHFYLDAEGHPFPTTVSYSAFVPVISGTTDSIGLFNAYTTLTSVNSASYFGNYLAEIHVTAKNEIELVPRQGRHRVLLGPAEDIAAKLAKLEAFYRTVVTPQNLDTWKTLNVAYSNQLVSTKYN